MVSCIELSNTLLIIYLYALGCFRGLQGALLSRLSIFDLVLLAFITTLTLTILWSLAIERLIKTCPSLKSLFSFFLFHLDLTTSTFSALSIWNKVFITNSLLCARSFSSINLLWFLSLRPWCPNLIFLVFLTSYPTIISPTNNVQKCDFVSFSAFEISS